MRADPLRGLCHGRRPARLPPRLPLGRGRDQEHARPPRQPRLPRHRRGGRRPGRRQLVPRRALDHPRDRAGQRRPDDPGSSRRPRSHGRDARAGEGDRRTGRASRADLLPQPVAEPVREARDRRRGAPSRRCTASRSASPSRATPCARRPRPTRRPATPSASASTVTPGRASWAARSPSGKAQVVERLGRVTAYTTGVNYFGHSVAETNDDLQALIGAADGFGTPGIIVPLDNGDLFRWCLAHGLRVFFVDEPDGHRHLPGAARRVPSLDRVLTGAATRTGPRRRRPPGRPRPRATGAAPHPGRHGAADRR